MNNLVTALRRHLKEISQALETFENIAERQLEQHAQAHQESGSLFALSQSVSPEKKTHSPQPVVAQHHEEFIATRH